MSMNIIMIVAHDQGQHMGCYGADVPTPRFDAFAEQGVRFDNSFCTAPQCSPSRAGLFTGRYPHANGVYGLTHAGFYNDLHDDEQHLAQLLGRAGYDTHLFGLQHETHQPSRGGFNECHFCGTSCTQVAPAMADWLAANAASGSPFYLQAGWDEPHRPFHHHGVELSNVPSVTVPPYLPPIPEVIEDMTALNASVMSADKAFGRILDAVDAADLADNTLVIFTVDHGIAFPHAKMTLYDPGIEVALMMRGPGLPSGRTCEQMISNVDVMPTILELIGQDVPDNVQGRSFTALLKDQPYTPREEIFAEKTYHTYYDPMRCIRTDRWKLVANFEWVPWQETSPDYFNNAKSYVEIAKAQPYPMHYHPPYELYDLHTDPYEQQNLADEAEHQATRDELICRLRQWMVDTGDPLLDGPIPQKCYVQRMEHFKQVSRP